MSVHPATVSVVIVSHNTREALRRCLASIRACRAEATMNVYVVDNASHDGSPVMVQRLFPEVRLLAQPWNLGFAAAMNLAIRGVRRGHLMWLNPDAELTPGAVRSMLSVLERHPRTGVVAPRLTHPDGSLQFSLRRRSFYHPLHLLSSAAGIGRFLPSVRRRLDGDRYCDWGHDSEDEIDYANGACLLARESAWRLLGPLDERFTIYSEDMDYCERIRQAGCEVRFAPSARVVHQGGASTRRVPILLAVHLRHSKRQFILKHFGRASAAAHRLAVALEGWIAALAALVPGRGGGADLDRALALIRWSWLLRVGPLPGAPPPLPRSRPADGPRPVGPPAIPPGPLPEEPALRRTQSAP